VAAAPAEQNRLNRLTLTQRVVAVADNALIVAGIGNAGFDLATAGDRPENFYMLGSMGLGIPIGHGLALAQPERPVIVLEGEGSVLMNLGALATVGREMAENLTIVIWDNEQWQLTGGQRLATASTCDLATVARGCGIVNVTTPADNDSFESDIRRALDSPGPHILVVKIDATAGVGRPHSDPIWHKYRFMQAVGVVPD
jgi:thiamine pyrophosphate-dependent acetolactate synthase large subunit-like protein